MYVRFLLCLMVLAMVVLWVGCAKPAAPPTGEPAPPAPVTEPAPTTNAAPAAATTAAPAEATNAASAAGAEELATCPVLGTTMPKSKMIPVEYEGKTYYVCCQDCVPKFKADPKKYIEHPAKALPPSQGM